MDGAAAPDAEDGALDLEHDGAVGIGDGEVAVGEAERLLGHRQRHHVGRAELVPHHRQRRRWGSTSSAVVSPEYLRCGSRSSRSGSRSSRRRLHARAGAAWAPLQRLLTPIHKQIEDQRMWIQLLFAQQRIAGE